MMEQQEPKTETALEKIQGFVRRYPGFERLHNLHLDYTDKTPYNGGTFPDGLIEVSRRRDVLGNVTLENQLNFGLYYIFPKDPGDDIGAAENADWVADFQQWVQEMSATGNAPQFGDVPHRERITAQNGTLYEADEEGTAMYMVQLSVFYVKKHKAGGQHGK